MTKKLILILFVTLYSTMVPIVAQQASTNSLDAQKEKRMEWFANAKLGIFIHWGIYSVKGFPRAGLSLISICLTKNT